MLNLDVIEEYEKINKVKIDIKKLKRSWNTFQFDKEFTFKLHPDAKTS